MCLFDVLFSLQATEHGLFQGANKVANTAVIGLTCRLIFAYMLSPCFISKLLSRRILSPCVGNRPPKNVVSY